MFWEQISLITPRMSSSCSESVVPSHEVFVAPGVPRSQPREWDREKEGGRRGELEREESGRLERTKQAAVSAICKSSEPLNCRAVKQNADSPGIQESKALCPVVGDGGQSNICTRSTSTR